MTDATCGGAGCTCNAGENGFCSEYCKDHAESAGHVAETCQCGHDDCDASAA
jgi:hypothetical protein